MFESLDFFICFCPESMEDNFSQFGTVKITAMPRASRPVILCGRRGVHVFKYLLGSLKREGYNNNYNGAVSQPPLEK